MSISVEALAARLREAFADGIVEADGDGYHFQVAVTSPVFAGLRPVQRQQKVYAVVQDWIASGELHALSIQTRTPDEAGSAS